MRSNDESRFLKPLSRRNVLKTMGVLSAAGLFGGLQTVFPNSVFARSPQRRPNILFILSDDHRWDFMSGVGHPFVQTPNLDRLADEGVLFKNAFVTTSLCSPSRASFLTGRYAHHHGVINNVSPWNNDNVTFLELLKRGGYDTAFIGKWHMPGEFPKLRGLDEFVTFTVEGGQGRYWNCPLIENGVEVQPREPYITDELTRRALAYIERRHDNPFCLYLSLKAVHHNWSPPKETRDLYRDVKVPLPAEADNMLGFTNGNMLLGYLQPVADVYRKYCRVVTSMDSHIGVILKRLDDLGLRNDTIVVYAGDNGYLFGEHRKLDKREAYEESIRIPFIVRYPGFIPDPSRRAGQMVLNIDLAPTLLAAAGLPIPENMDGESFLPILASGASPGRQQWLYEVFKDFPQRTPPLNAVRTNRHIYIEYEDSRPFELFDLVKDPRQHRNLSGTPEGDRLLPELKRQLLNLQKAGRTS
ncbi:MAG: sulfatase-like hydrolase/transferase [Acidobacteria bacterium]|nr:sulfatase-like hydrolase/transferase [Acidobacteriota bacterium]